MAQDVQRVRMLLGHDFQRRVVVNAERGIHQLAVDLAGQGGLGQARADGGGHFGNGYGMLERTLAAVGKSDVDHGIGLFEEAENKKGRQASFVRDENLAASVVAAGSAHVARLAAVSRRPLGLGVIVANLRAGRRHVKNRRSITNSIARLRARHFGPGPLEPFHS